MITMQESTYTIKLIYLLQICRNHSNSHERDGELMISPKPTMSNTKYNFSFAGPSFSTSSRSSLRSIDKLEANGSHQLPAFEYEFKRKPYASFNSYSIIPPIKNKSDTEHKEPSTQIDPDEENVDTFLEQEISFSNTQKFVKLTNNNNRVRTNNKS